MFTVTYNNWRNHPLNMLLSQKLQLGFEILKSDVKMVDFHLSFRTLWVTQFDFKAANLQTI